MSMIGVSGSTVSQAISSATRTLTAPTVPEVATVAIPSKYVSFYHMTCNNFRGYWYTGLTEDIKIKLHTSIENIVPKYRMQELLTVFSVFGVIALGVFCGCRAQLIIYNFIVQDSNFLYVFNCNEISYENIEISTFIKTI